MGGGGGGCGREGEGVEETGAAEPERGMVRVRREKLVACMTCPLCKELLREATAIVECLHTFCRACIMKKIEDDEIESCPVCYIDLGCAPEEKLRPDHNIQDIINKVFPLKRTNVDASTAAAVTLPAKIKQRSLSSLAVETPSVATQTGLTGRRTKTARRAPTPGATSLSNNGTMKLANKSEGRDQKTEKFSAPQSAKSTTAANRKQSNADIVASSQTSSEDRKTGKTIDRDELSKPLNSFLDARGARSFRSVPKNHAGAAKGDRIKSGKTEFPIRKDGTMNKVASTGTRVSAQSKRSKSNQESNGNYSEPAASEDKSIAYDNLRKSPETDSQQELLGSTSTSSLHDQITNPVWFSLAASSNQKEAKLLPQLPKKYLRIKDGSLQVSSIQRYIMNKLALASSDEVEIISHGKPICPSTTLHGLVDLYVSREPAQLHKTAVGAPAKEFVMELSYRRRRRRRAGARSLCCTSSSPEYLCHCSDS